MYHQLNPVESIDIFDDELSGRALQDNDVSSSPTSNSAFGNTSRPPKP